MSTPHPLRCRCGKFQAEVRHPERGMRAVCYCRDCQAFAHFLGLPPGMLDAHAGTEIVAVRPRDVRFVQGAEHLACMSLGPKGLVRWFTSCCRTPIGNTPRDVRLAHVGLVHTALESTGSDLARTFGPVRMRVNRQGAQGRPEASPPLTFFAAIARYMTALAWARVSGNYRTNPFFDAATGRPRVEPQVLSPEEHRKLKSAVSLAGEPG
jgi:hypothetical protein